MVLTICRTSFLHTYAIHGTKCLHGYVRLLSLWCVSFYSSSCIHATTRVATSWYIPLNLSLLVKRCFLFACIIRDVRSNFKRRWEKRMSIEAELRLYSTNQKAGISKVFKQNIETLWITTTRRIWYRIWIWY